MGFGQSTYYHNTNKEVSRRGDIKDGIVGKGERESHFFLHT